MGDEILTADPYRSDSDGSSKRGCFIESARDFLMLVLIERELKEILGSIPYFSSMVVYSILFFSSSSFTP